MTSGNTSNIHCEIEERAQGMVVHIIGELGLPPGTDLFQKEFIGVLAKRPKVVVLDLSKLTFLSSLGIGLLVDAQHNTARHDGQMRVAGVVPGVMEVFKRTRVAQLFQFLIRLKGRWRSDWGRWHTRGTVD